MSAGELVGLSDAALRRRLDEIQSADVRWVRFDVSWNRVEPRPGVRDWSAVDRVVDAARARGLQVLATIGYTPPWARVRGCPAGPSCAPRDVGELAGFAAAVVARYAPRGLRTWEVWNEPNSARFWWPQPDVPAYASALISTARAIRAVQPGATVLVGGLAPSTDPGSAPARFVASLVRAGAGRAFDAVAVHPYSYPALPGEPEPWSGWTQMDAVHRVLVGLGRAGAPVWATEFGAPTRGPGPQASFGSRRYGQHPDHVDLDLQARTVTAALAQQDRSPWLGPLFWYTVADLSPAPSVADSFGLLTADGRPKPAFRRWVEARAR